MTSISPHRTCQHRVYGLTCDEFELLLARADGRCELCKIPVELTPRGLLGIDHDNVYGWKSVRGLVCDKCNAHLAQVDARRRSRGDHPKSFDYYLNAWFLRYVRSPGPVQVPRTDDGDHARSQSHSAG